MEPRAWSREHRAESRGREKLDPGFPPIKMCKKLLIKQLAGTIARLND